MGKEPAATNDPAADFEPASSEPSAAVRRRWYNICPALNWVRAYQPNWLRSDLIAGVTLAAYLMPAGLADASLANLPPEAGLYACLFSGFVFWLFCSSRHTAITVTSAISVLVGASLGDLAGGDPSRFCALAALLLGKRFLKNKPVALFVVIAGIIVAASMDLGSLGVKLLGQVPQGLPPFGFPAVHPSDLNDLLPLALGCFLLGMVETAALGRMFAVKHGYRFDANQELLGIAGANVMAGLGHGFPVSGGMSQSLVNESGGARTPLSGFIAALLMLLIVLFVSGALRYLPQPVLAAIVLMAVTGLFKLTALKQFC